ncbi:MAG: N-formylglutamate amidohydrolase [Hyphomonadaceae bacterium]|nr:N-formylglutamate amidohydrolase [Hyphomonadaceae bacterium]
MRRLVYLVAATRPFAGGHTTQTYDHPAHGVHTLQIEINRALYLDESTPKRSNSYIRGRVDMSRLQKL